MSASDVPASANQAGLAGRRSALTRRLRVIVPALPCLVLLAFALDRWASRHEILRGVWASGVSLGGLNSHGALEALAGLDARLRALPVPARLEGRLYQIRPEELGLHLVAERIATAALSAGRGGSVVAQGLWWLSRLRRPHELPLEIELDRGRLERVLGELEHELGFYRGPQAGVLVKHGVPVAVYAEKTRRIDRDESERLLGAAFRGVERNVVALPVREIGLAVERAEVDRALGLAERVLSAPVTLASPDPPRELVLSAADLAHALESRVAVQGTLALTLDPSRLEAVLGERVRELEVPPQPASFVVEKQVRVSLRPSQPGFLLPKESLATAALAAASSSERRGALPFLRVEAEGLSTSAAEALGVRHFLGQFVTRFQCCEPRVKNIERIASLIDGVVLNPGQTFSVNEHVGPRTEANGFVPAPSIADGEMVETVGGGISQFATTLFNAVFHAGIDVVERQPHSYWFPRYPMGHEATLSWPKPDLVFKNDTDAGLLIKTEVGRTHVVVRLFGDHGGRRVLAEVSPRRDVVQPAVELIADDSLPADEEKVRAAGMVGWTVTVSRVTRFQDGTERTEKRKVVYAPRARVVAVHSCRIPKDEPGYTGTPCPEPEDAELPDQPVGTADGLLVADDT